MIPLHIVMVIMLLFSGVAPNNDTITRSPGPLDVEVTMTDTGAVQIEWNQPRGVGELYAMRAGNKLELLKEYRAQEPMFMKAIDYKYKLGDEYFFIVSDAHIGPFTPMIKQIHLPIVKNASTGGHYGGQ